MRVLLDTHAVIWWVDQDSRLVLIGHWLDLYVTIVPVHSPEPRVTGWDLAIALGAFAAVGWAVTRRDTVETRLVLAPTV